MVASAKGPLLNNDAYLIFLLRSALNHKVNTDGLLQRLLQTKKPDESRDLLLAVADVVPSNKQALDILSALYQAHGSHDRQIQGRYLAALVECGQLQEALKLQQKLPLPVLEKRGGEIEEEDEVQRLIEDGMPEKRKEKKTRDIVQETKGGAEIFMPNRKKKKNIKYPKNFDPKNPGPEPDLERWLPKWQRSRFKKLAKKKGIYLKGAQADAQADTDVTQGITQSTAHQEVVQDKAKTNKRRKK